MGHLILAVAASSLVAILMRISEAHVKNNFAMFMANYFVCSTIALLYMTGKQPFAMREGLPFAAGLGLISGSLYLINFVLLKYCIGKSGVMLSSIFMKLGVIVPALMAILVFGEQPKAVQILGLVLAAAAILLIYLEPQKADGVGINGEVEGVSGASARTLRTGSLMLILLLVVSGFTESMANIYDKTGVADAKNHFLLFNFFTAFLLSGAITLIKRQHVGWKDIAFGVIIGIPNYHATRFLLLALGSVPAVITYPVYNIGAIVLISLAGVLLFKERLTLRKLFGLLLIAAALVLLNI